MNCPATSRIALLLGLSLTLAAPSPASAAAPVLHGRVEAPDGAPAAGVRVSLLPHVSAHDRVLANLRGGEPPAPAVAVESDAGGRFSLPAPTPGVWNVEVRAPGFVPLRYGPVPTVGPVTLPTAALLPDAGLAITVESPDGPVAEALVSAVPIAALSAGGAEAEGWRPAPRLARTGEDGRVALPRRVGEELYVTALFPDALDATAERAAGDTTLRFRDLAKVPRRLVVTEADGRPAGRVAVTVGSARLPLAVIGEDGVLEQPRSTPGPVVVDLWAADGRHRREMLDPWRGSDAETVAEARIVLPAAAEIRGRVVSAGDGSPIAGALVEGRSGSQDVTRSVSDAEGRFALSALDPHRRYRIVAAYPGRIPVRREVIAGSAGERSRRVVLELPASRPVRGVVVDEHERPVAEAVVAIAPASDDGTVPEPGAGNGARGARDLAVVRTGADGRFRVPAPPARVIDLAVRKAGYEPALRRRVAIDAGSPDVPNAELGAIVLRPAASLRGRVETADGDPLPGARVWIFEELDGPPETLIRRAFREEPSATAGPDGAFVVRDLPRGRPVHLVADLSGHLPAVLVGVRPSDPEPTLRLEPALRLVGRVIDDAGEPVPDARLDLEPRRASSAIAPRRGLDLTLTVFSDQGGEFEFPEVSPGRYALSAAANGFLRREPVPLTVRRDDLPADLEVVLTHGVAVVGTVTGGRGEFGIPVEDARVSADGVRVTTDGEGRYRLEGLRPGSRRIEVFHPAYERAARRVEVGRYGAEADFTLAAGHPVTGRVTDASGAPVADAVVALARGGEDPRRYRAISGSDGRFAVERVAAGRYDVAAAADGFAPARFADRLTVGDGPVAELELRLEPGARIVGWVLGAQGDELTRLRIAAERRDGGGRTGVVDHRGNYEVRDLAPGTYRLVATLDDGSRAAEAWVTVRPGEETVRKDLELDQGVRLGGAVTYDGAPLPGARVSLLGLSVASRRSVLTDQRGEFRLDGLKPGRYRLGVSSPRDALTENREIDVYGDRDVAVDLSTLRVAGVVAAADTEEPLDGAAVSFLHLLGDDPADGASRLTVTTGRTGTFDFARLVPGRYQLRVERPGYQPVERLLDLAAGPDRTDEVILMYRVAGIEAVVRLASGGSPPHAILSVVDPSGRPVRSETRMLDTAGHGSFSTLTASAPRIRVEAPGGAPTVVPGPGAGAPLEIVLPPAAPLRVEIPALADSTTLAVLTVAGADGRPFEVVETSGIVRRSWQVVAGQATVPNLPAGTWWLRAMAADGRVWEGSVTTDGGLSGPVRLD